MFSRVLAVPVRYRRFGTLSCLRNEALPLTSNPQQYDQEYRVIELLKSISPKPVPKSKFPYKEAADRSKRSILPRVPEMNKETVNTYVHELTNYTYAPGTHKLIKELLTRIVDSTPDLLSKQSYLDIVQDLHFYLDDPAAEQTMDRMEESTAFKRDIDFHNVMMAFSMAKTTYEDKIERLQNLKQQGVNANANTWYYLFRALRTNSKRFELLELMPEYGIDQEPVFRSAVHSMSTTCGYDELIEFYEKNGYNLDNIDTYLMNKLCRACLNEDNVSEAFKLVHGMHMSNRARVNLGTFSAFNTYFLNRNEIYNCVAFCHKFQYQFKVKASHILAYELIDKYLTKCTFFEHWPQLTRYMVHILTHNTAHKNFLQGRHFKLLANYARIHGLQDFVCRAVEPEDLAFGQEMWKKLHWPRQTIPSSLDQNSKDFIEMAKLISPSLETDMDLNPSDILKSS
ncbi:hypothetical protein KL936_004419 [Ogataea polymorpha]|nr:hypothetical protein KL936_004419 [Ogataea polymorpha]